MLFTLMDRMWGRPLGGTRARFPQDDFRPASVHSPGRRFFCHDPDFGRNPPLLSNGDVPSTWPGAERPPHQGMACLNV
jgi:hypothetical protein